MINSKKTIFIIIFILAFGFFLKEKKDLTNQPAFISLDDYSLAQETTIAACPTFHYLVDKLNDNQEIIVRKTQSTNESLTLLEQGKVDLIVSGRALKQTEPDFLFQIIGPGYDFIFQEEIVIFDNEMALIPFYTDLDSAEIIEKFDYISEDNLTETDNPYHYLDKGIVIVFLKDKLKGEIVHVFDQNQSRVRLSRRPRLYYSENLSTEQLNFVKQIIKEN
jgi:hypothetical protein